MPKTFVVITTQFPALHSWPDAPAVVSFLRYTHRHIFHVTVKFIVDHEDRQREFFIEKMELDKYINKTYLARNTGSMSCETMAKEICHAMNADFTSVYEDNENGAEYYRTFELR